MKMRPAGTAPGRRPTLRRKMSLGPRSICLGESPEKLEFQFLVLVSGTELIFVKISNSNF